MNQQYKPMDLGNILDTSWKIYKERFFTLIGIMAVANLPLAILSLLIGYSVNNTNTENPGSILLIIFMMLVGLFCAITLFPLATGAGVKVASEGFLGNQLSISEGFKESFKRYFALLVPLFFSYLNIAVCTMIGLIGLIIGSPIAYIFLTTLFIFIPQAVMIDDKGYFGAMDRSSRLVMTDFWRVLGIGIVMVILIGILSLLVNLPGLLPYYILGKESITGQFFYNIFSFLSGILIGPYSLTVITVLYYDLKIRKENFNQDPLQQISEQNNLIYEEMNKIEE